MVLMPNAMFLGAKPPMQHQPGVCPCALCSVDVEAQQRMNDERYERFLRNNPQSVAKEGKKKKGGKKGGKKKGGKKKKK
jgi:hypothetical protein